METYVSKMGSETDTVAVTMDENEVCTLHRVCTITVGYGKKAETRIVADEFYKRQPRGSSDPWSYLIAGTYRSIDRNHVPAAVRQAWVMTHKPISEAKKPRKSKPQVYTDPDAIAAWLKRNQARIEHSDRLKAAKADIHGEVMH